MRMRPWLTARLHEEGDAGWPAACGVRARFRLDLTRSLKVFCMPGAQLHKRQMVGRVRHTSARGIDDVLNAARPPRIRSFQCSWPATHAIVAADRPSMDRNAPQNAPFPHHSSNPIRPPSTGDRSCTQQRTKTSGSSCSAVRTTALSMDHSTRSS